MEIRLFLKGAKACGKTALLIRGLSDMRMTSGGYVFLPLERPGGSSVVGVVSPGEAALPVLPYGAFASSQYEQEAFMETAGRAFNEIQEKGMGYIDAMLGRELSDKRLTEKLEALLSQEMPIMGAIADREAAGDKAAYDRILSGLIADGQTLIIDVDSSAPDEVIAEIRQWSETVQEWLRHKKFDPLMKLRGRPKK